jgi:acyl-CoA reductase-like NAD-dependent aldehyde dehydrogenase
VSKLVFSNSSSSFDASLKAADPSWSSVVIPNPSITSHETNPDLVGAFLPRDRRLITCYDPATAHHLNTVVADDQRDITEKISRATQAQKRWKHTTFAQRRKVVRSLKKWLVDNQDACARVACRDTGKTSKSSGERS